MTAIKNPLIISASLLGLSLAVTGCSSTTAQPMYPKDGNMIGDHRGYDKKADRHDGKWGGHGKEGMKGGMSHPMAELNLTDTQKAQIAQLRTQNQARMQQFKTQIDQMDANIAAQKAAGASSATLLNLYKQKQAMMEQFFAMHQQEKQQFINILTPDQQLKLYESRGRGHGGKDGKRPPMPPMQSMPAGTAQK